MPAVPATRAVPRRRAAVLAACLLLPLAVAGCGGDEETGEGKSGSARDLAVVSREQVRAGGTVRWAVDAVPATLNTFHADAGPATERVAEATLPTLFTLDSRARPRPHPAYLVSAEVTDTEPQQTVVYTLNPEARWSDGTPIALADFQAQWKALSGSDASFWTARTAGYERIHKVVAGPERHQVKVVFARPHGDWRSLFTPLYPRTVMGDPGAFNDTSRTRLDLAAGPFRVRGGTLDPEADTLALERNPKWWGDRAKLDALVLTEVPHAERGAALAAGELEVAEVRESVAERIAAARPRGTADPSRTPGVASPPASSPQAGPTSAPGTGGPDPDSVDDGSADGDGDADGKPGEGAEERKDAEERDAREAAQRNLRTYTVRRAYRPAYTQLALNGTSGPLADERVRRAVARALDRQELAAAAQESAGLPVQPLGNHLTMYDQVGYRDNSGVLGEPGVESAAALLTEAGWRGGPAVPRSARPERADAAPADAAPADAAPADAAPTGDDADADAKPREAATTGADSAHALTAPAFSGVAGSTATGRAGVLRQAAHALARAAEDAEDAASDEDGKSAEDAGNAEDAEDAEEARDADAKADGGRDADALRAAAEAAAARAERAAASLDRLLSAHERLVRVKEGDELELRMVLPASEGSEQLRETGRQIVRMLRRVGVHVELTQVPDADFFQDHIASGDFDLALYAWPATAYPVTDARPVFAKPVPAPDGSLLIEQNYTRVGTDEIDQLFEQAGAELDEEARRDLVQRIDARIWAAAASIPLYQGPERVAVDRALAGVGAFGLQTPRYEDIGYLRTA
ncbi:MULTISPECIES: ABC transporter family substrate-binding protein [Streptomyces]|uniref:ABC transporter family substrate-binding protein n=1 Tax=Streptomyces TaxID=1883 RepID=UPI00224992C3|nr:ABC transporter family substrate-binding protein [Streptomyces sp. JHD 1]MCX2971791.1 ABC transporter family substrate-binding protein [Streptomyces sp. JHD 1]